MKKEGQTFAYVNTIAIASIRLEGAVYDLVRFINIESVNLSKYEDIKRFILKEILPETMSAVNNYKAVIINCKDIPENEKRLATIVIPNFKFLMNELKNISFNKVNNDDAIIEKINKVKRELIGLDLMTQKMINS